jgi:eukaryotic-like serine/threonine-protein kinase
MEAPVKEGEVLAGKYRVERVLGVGGMGVVVAAYHLMLDRRVAVKFLLSEAQTNPEVVARFARGARAAVKIESEHVARVIDVGELPNGAPYMVMEYLEGKDLGDVVAERGALPAEEAVNYVLQASEALAEAHTHGIVHRDLKPANLFLTRRADGSMHVKVLDFGISKSATPAGAPDMGLTKTASVMGSPLYMSPEQMRSTRTVDARTDIWALGVILYELISGRLPFEATTMPELCALVLTEEPASLATLQPGLPPALAAAVARCLEKDPNKRFPNVAAFANAIAAFGPKRSIASAERISRVLREAGVDASTFTEPSVAPAAPVVQASTGAEASVAVRPGDSTSSAWSPATTGAERPKPRSRAPFIVAGAAIVVCGVGGALWFRGAGVSNESMGSANATNSSAKLVTELAPKPPPAPIQTSQPSATAAAPAVEPAATPSASVSASASAVRRAPASRTSTSGVRTSKKSASAPGATTRTGATPSPAAPQPEAPQPPAQVKKNPLDIGLK